MKVILIIFKTIVIVVASILISSIFGALHNQLSYTVSDEFFKNFLFGEFGTKDWNINNDRVEASVIGVLGSYWVGFYLGIIYAIIFLFLRTENTLRIFFKAILINVLIA
jgi:hypothetical protein